MKQIDKIVKGIVEPKDINVLWLDTNDPKSPILKAYADGEWKAISSEGGGGSAEGAVSYSESQELTEEQQIQARKNQGLYYKEETEGVIEKQTEVPDDFRAAFFDTLGESIPDEVWNNASGIGGLVKVSDDTPSRNDFISLIYTEYDDEGEIDYSEEVSLVGSDTIDIDGGYYNIYYGNGYYCLIPDYNEAGDILDAQFLVVTEDSGVDLTVPQDVVNTFPGISSTVHLSKGLYVNEYYGIYSAIVLITTTVKYNYNGIVTVYNNPIEPGFTGAVSYKEEQSLVKSEQMQARINQGLYAESEETIITFDGDLEKVTDYFPISDNLYMIKVSDRTDLDLNNIVGMSVNGQELPDDTIKALPVITTADLNSYISFDVPVTILFNGPDGPLAFITDGATITPYNEETPIYVSGLYVWGEADGGGF